MNKRYEDKIKQIVEAHKIKNKIVAQRETARAKFDKLDKKLQDIKWDILELCIEAQTLFNEKG